MVLAVDEYIYLYYLNWVYGNKSLCALVCEENFSAWFKYCIFNEKKGKRGNTEKNGKTVHPGHG